MAKSEGLGTVSQGWENDQIAVITVSGVRLKASDYPRTMYKGSKTTAGQRICPFNSLPSGPQLVNCVPDDNPADFKNTNTNLTAGGESEVNFVYP